MEERRAKEKAEREAVRQRQRREKRANKKLQKQKTKQPAERHEQVYPSGRREIWIMPGCEEKPPVEEGSGQREETPEPMAEQTSNPDVGCDYSYSDGSRQHLTGCFFSYVAHKEVD